MVKVDSCKEGDMLANDVYGASGLKLVNGDTVIDAFVIEKLKQFGIEHIRIYEREEREAQTEQEAYSKQMEGSYRKNTDEVKQIINRLATGEKLDPETVTAATDQVYNDLSSNTGMNILFFLSQIKDKNDYTYQHSVNVAFYSMLLAKWLDMGEEEVKNAARAGLLHDIGKSRVPLAILDKPDKLTDEEFKIMMMHPMLGYKMLEEGGYENEEVKNAVLMHHEHMNQTGYPKGIPEKTIGMLARIVTVADVYDALTSDRAYKKRMHPFAVFDLFLHDADNLFDSSVATKFVNNMALFFTGADVMLNNGDEGKIVYVPPYNKVSPVIYSKGKYLTHNEDGVLITELL
jgi:uncharacterized domain HDIG